MENPFGEFTYQIMASTYNQYQKVVSKRGSGPETSSLDAPKRSAEWFADIMADMAMDNDDEELIKDGENHRGSKFPATVEGYAEDNSDWLLVGLAAPDGTQTPSTSQRKLKNSHLPDTQNAQSHNTVKHGRYVSRIDGTGMPGDSQQSNKRDCPQASEDVSPNDCDNDNNKCTRRPGSGIDLLMSMRNEQTQAEMDMLIAGLQRLTVRDFQTTVDEEEQPESEGSVFETEETTTTDNSELSTWDHVPKPVGEVSNPSSSSPSSKRLVLNFLGKNLKAKVQGWRDFFKQPVNEPDGQQQQQQAKMNPPRYLEPYRYYTLGEYDESE
ncbi:hypothetical protein F4679DRAFT_584493 [Xylaria curta]|nr:hypothetical protein F4679DRAFT_584493 [Xylaria curta]